MPAPDTAAPRPDDPPRLLSPREVCDLLSFSKAALDRHVKHGAIPPPIRIGRGKNPLRRWRAADIHAVILAGSPDTAPDDTPPGKEAA